VRYSGVPLAPVPAALRSTFPLNGISSLCPKLLYVVRMSTTLQMAVAVILAAHTIGI
jgi:hypothetical protein